mmetsp:Transcript_14642/g.25992  ORF Transcript_14642/g.25992 Transcript_14642/m.25992 type:complete len:135 (-) Transcript_14642:134-538(-)
MPLSKISSINAYFLFIIVLLVLVAFIAASPATVAARGAIILRKGTLLQAEKDVRGPKLHNLEVFRAFRQANTPSITIIPAKVVNLLRIQQVVRFHVYCRVVYVRVKRAKIHRIKVKCPFIAPFCLADESTWSRW